MKIKNILFGLFALVSVLGLASCTPSENGDDPNGDIIDDPNDNTGDTPDKEVLYTVNVKMPDGSPANATNVGAEIRVQLCTAEGCKTPVKVDDEGKVEFEESNQITAKDTYFIHLLYVPETYTFDANETLSASNKELTINLSTLSTYSSGTGDSAEDAYKITNAGYYKMTLASASDVVYFDFTPTQAGTYEIETMINLFDRMPVDKFIPTCDPLVYAYTVENGAVTPSDSILNDDISNTNCNSRISLVVDEAAVTSNTTYSFAIQLSKTSQANQTNGSIEWGTEGVTFTFSLLKK